MCVHKIKFQSTLPREERLFQGIFFYFFSYFNPRSHERSDPALILSSMYWNNFNPRSHERSDHIILPYLLVILYFNPRSHERSDLDNIFHNYPIFRNFNPRSHERSDNIDCGVIDNWRLFQSTLPREERQQYCTKNLFIFIQYRQ